MRRAVCTGCADRSVKWGPLGPCSRDVCGGLWVRVVLGRPETDGPEGTCDADVALSGGYRLTMEYELPKVTPGS